MKTISKVVQHLQKKGKAFLQAENTAPPEWDGTQIKHPKGIYPLTNGSQTYSMQNKKILTDKHVREGGKKNPEATTYFKPEDFIWKNRFVLLAIAKIIIQTGANAKQCNVVSSLHRGSSRVSAAAVNGFAKQQLSAGNKPPVSSLLLHQSCGQQGNWQESPQIHTTAAACKSH